MQSNLLQLLLWHLLLHHLPFQYLLPRRLLRLLEPLHLLLRQSSKVKRSSRSGGQPQSDQCC